MIPIKTNDVIDYDGKKYVVGRIIISDGEPLAELNPVKSELKIVPVKSIKLMDEDEANFRIKSLVKKNNYDNK